LKIRLRKFFGPMLPSAGNHTSWHIVRRHSFKTTNA